MQIHLFENIDREENSFITLYALYVILHFKISYEYLIWSSTENIQYTG